MSKSEQELPILAANAVYGYHPRATKIGWTTLQPSYMAKEKVLLNDTKICKRFKRGDIDEFYKPESLGSLSVSLKEKYVNMDRYVDDLGSFMATQEIIQSKCINFSNIPFRGISTKKECKNIMDSDLKNEPVGIALLYKAGELKTM